MNDISYKIAEVLPTPSLSEAISLYNSACAEYFATLKKEESISAFLLLDEILSERGIKKSAITIRRNADGRPVLSGADIDFSVAHCKNVCACAVLFGNGKIGCDIQLKEEASDEKLLQNARYFTNEQELIELYKCADKAEFYSALWSQKEAFLKANGKGIDSDLREIEFSRVQVLKDIYIKDNKIYYLSICR